MMLSWSLAKLDSMIKKDIFLSYKRVLDRLKQIYRKIPRRLIGIFLVMWANSQFGNIWLEDQDRIGVYLLSIKKDTNESHFWERVTKVICTYSKGSQEAMQ